MVHVNPVQPMCRSHALLQPIDYWCSFLDLLVAAGMASHIQLEMRINMLLKVECVELF